MGGTITFLLTAVLFQLETRLMRLEKLVPRVTPHDPFDSNHPQVRPGREWLAQDEPPEEPLDR